MAPDAVTLIMNDHRVLENLFEMLKDPNSDRPSLVAEVTARLSAHSWAEEEKVYPALVKADPSAEAQVHHGMEEHHEATELLHRLQTVDPSSPQFNAALKEFVEAVAHHVEEEESEILPEMAQSFNQTKLAELGRAFEERRLEILQAHGISDEAVDPGGVDPGGAAAQLAAAERAGRRDVANRRDVAGRKQPANRGDAAAMSREELYGKAKAADIPGRSQMSKEQLARAIQQQR